jgi:Bacterial aa3 type cytochrome c oxidase subunit IV
MAAHDAPEYSTAAGNDYAAHEQTYEMFLSLVKWHVIVIGIILSGMAYFLT